MNHLLFLIVAFIAYGSCYPFNFQGIDNLSLGRSQVFLSSPGDIVGNIALFIPFGLIGLTASRRMPGQLAPVIALVIAGSVFASVLQGLQLFLPTRVPAFSDVVWNMVGIGIGIGIGPLAQRSTLPSIASYQFTRPVAIGALWILAELSPFVPSLDLQGISDSVKPLVRDPVVHWGPVLMHSTGWIVALHLLSQPYSPAKHARWWAVLPVLALLAQPFVIRNHLSIDECLGAVIGAMVWLLFRTRLSAAPLVAGTCVGLIVSVVGVAEQPVGDTVSKLTSNDVMLEIFFGCALVWSLERAGVRFIYALGITCIGLLALEIFANGITTNAIENTLSVGIITLALGSLGRETTRSTGSNVAGAGQPSGRIAPALASAPNVPNSTNSADRATYLKGLDGLRAAAAVSVFAVHFNQHVHLTGHIGPIDIERLLTNGNPGVALFFVLSGFLLSIPFWRAHPSFGSQPVIRSQYAANRLARILPAYYACLALIVGAKAAFSQAPDITNVLAHALLIFAWNDHFIFSINPPFWTLAVEMQFYLALPLLFIILNRLPLVAGFATIGACAVFAYAANYNFMTWLITADQWPLGGRSSLTSWFFVSGPQSQVLKHSVLAHLSHLLLGVTTAWIFVTKITQRESTPNQPQRASWIGNDVILVASALCVLLILSTPMDAALELPHGRYNWPVVPLLLCLVVVACPGTKYVANLLECSPFRWLGLVSYGVYIFHFPVQKAVAKLMSIGGLNVMNHSLVFGAASFALTLALASASYVLLERPIMRAVKRRGRASIGSHST